MKRGWPGWFGLLAVAAVWAAGPAPNSTAPPLTIAPVNVKGDPYDVIAKADGKPCIVFFVREVNGESGSVSGFVEALFRRSREHGLNAAVVLLGGADLREQIAQSDRLADIAVPLAVVAPDSEELPAWKLGEGTKNLMVFVHDGKVSACLDNLTKDDKDRIVAAADKILE